MSIVAKWSLISATAELLLRYASEQTDRQTDKLIAILRTTLPRGKGKQRKSIYIAPFRTKIHTKRSGMDHTVLPANNNMPAFPL